MSYIDFDAHYAAWGEPHPLDYDRWCEPQYPDDQEDDRWHEEQEYYEYIEQQWQQDCNEEAAALHLEWQIQHPELQ